MAGEAGALDDLVTRIDPVIRVRVTRVLLYRRPHAGRDVSQEVDDLSQEILLRLFRNEARVLRAWDPDRGLSLLNFVGLIAERETSACLQSGRRSPWSDESLAPERLDAEVSRAPSAEQEVEASELLADLLDQLRQRLSPTGLELFRRLFVEEQEVSQVCSDLSMKPNAVHAWRSRLRRTVRELAGDFMSVSDDTGSSPSRPETESNP